MMIPDVNVLLYAADPDAPLHQPAFSWLRQALEGPERVGFAIPVLGGLIRIATHPKILAKPVSVHEALAFADFLVQNGLLLEATSASWHTFCDLVNRSGVRGNAITDASLAALAIAHQAQFVTFDRDFRRFPGLDYLILQT